MKIEIEPITDKPRDFYLRISLVLYYHGFPVSPDKIENRVIEIKKKFKFTRIKKLIPTYCDKKKKKLQRKKIHSSFDAGIKLSPKFLF